MTDQRRDDDELPARMAFGRIMVVVTPDGEVVLRRDGVAGRGVAAVSRMWCLDQVEAAHIAASNRRGADAVCEARALRWAIQRLVQAKKRE